MLDITEKPTIFRVKTKLEKPKRIWINKTKSKLLRYSISYVSMLFSDKKETERKNKYDKIMRHIRHQEIVSNSDKMERRRLRKENKGKISFII